MTKEQFAEKLNATDTLFRRSRRDVIGDTLPIVWNLLPQDMVIEAFGKPYKIDTRIEGTGIKRKDRMTWGWMCQDGASELRLELHRLPNDSRVLPEHRGKVMVKWDDPL